MNTYLVVFEIQDAEKIAAITAYFKSFLTWAKITDTCFAIVTDKTAREIRDELVRDFDQGDRIFISLSGHVAAWKNSRCTNKWLKENL